MPGTGRLPGETRRNYYQRVRQPVPDVEIPHQALHVWHWFWELSTRRHSGPEPISYADIGQWLALTGQPVEPTEISMLVAMDDAYLGAMRKEQEAQRAEAAEKAKTGR